MKRSKGGPWAGSFRRVCAGSAVVLVIAAAWYIASGPGGRRPQDGIGGEEQGRSDALQALDFWTRARAYPDRDISPDKFYAAYLRSKEEKKAPGRSPMASSVWESIGPVNLPGRTISIAINPVIGTVYVGSASGGLWRSYSGGLSGDWQRVETGYPVLGVGAIAIDPQDTNTMFIGTGEVYRYQGALGGVVIRTTRGSYGIGILKTTDGGATWTKSLDWTFNQQRGVEAIRMNPLNSSTMLAATTEGLYRTSDRGQTWSQRLALPMGEDIVYNTADTNRVLATIGNFSSPGAGLYASTDGGITWFQQGSFPSFSGKAMLDTYPPNPSDVYASVADSTTSVSSLWKSPDFGATWNQISSQDVAGVQGWYSHFVAVKPDDSSRVVRAGVSIYNSSNGGATITGSSGSYSDHHAFARFPLFPTILYVVNDDGVYRSVDFGTSFTSLGAGLATGQFYNGFSNSATDSLLAIGQVQDHIPGYKYTGSVSWGRTALDECGWTVINQKNDWTMFAIDRNGGSVGRSTNRGSSFPTVVSFSAVGSWNSPILMAPSDTNVLYAGTDRVYKSVNRGTNWSTTSTTGFLDGNTCLSMAVSATSSDTLYVGKPPLGARSHVFMTPNGGASWNDITGTLPDRYPMDLAVDPRNSRIVYAALAGTGAGHIFRTTNSGGTWSDVSGTLPDIPTTAVFVDPANSSTVYAGNDIGVYVSTNSGASWNSFSDGLPDAVLIASLSISPSNRMLRAATHGNGVYQRRIPSAFPSLTLTSPVGGETLLATSDQNVTWTSTLVSAVKVEYSSNNGLSWHSISDSVAGAAGTVSWHIPYVTTNQGRVRISALDAPSITDSSHTAFSITFNGVVAAVQTGWNIISLPVRTTDPRTQHIFLGASSPAFDFEGSYQLKDSLVNGRGYWLRYPSPGDIPILGDSIASDTIEVAAGWNLIGPGTLPVAQAGIGSNPAGLVVSRAFGYSSGYHHSDTLFPGYGYWVKTSDSGELYLAGSLAKRSLLAASPLPPNELRITDASGSSQTLYFGFRGGFIDEAGFEMPPPPPAESFDASFPGRMMAALFRAGEVARTRILISGASYPLKFRASIRAGEASLLIDGVRRPLPDGEAVTVGVSAARLELEMGTGQSTPVPRAFALFQNYPNPFNPSTEIRYDVPSETRVVLNVYDLLGRKVTALVDEMKDPGSFTARWDASSMPSGIYYYVLRAGGFSRTRAMALVR